MGALLSDAVLQTAMNYRNVVVPRVHRVLIRFPEAVTTIAFRDVLTRVGAADVLNWSHPEKPRRLLGLTTFLVDNCVFTVTAFRMWLLEDINAKQLLSLRGVGPKTIDYMKKLCGIDAIAVDRHLRMFALRAGVPDASYHILQQIVEHAASLLSVSYSELDRLIWVSESAPARSR
jgi:hypothetical protein